MSALRYVPFDALALAVVVSVVVAAVASAPALARRDARAALVAASRTLLVGAVLSVVAVTLLGGGGASTTNLVPGAGVAASLENVNSDLGRLNVAGNVALFVPIGLLAFSGTGLRWLGATAAAAGLSLVVEATQLLVGRSADIDDVILNTLGGAAGAALGLLVASRLWGPTPASAQPGRR